MKNQKFGQKSKILQKIDNFVKKLELKFFSFKRNGTNARLLKRDTLNLFSLLNRKRF